MKLIVILILLVLNVVKSTVFLEEDIKSYLELPKLRSSNTTGSNDESLHVHKIFKYAQTSYVLHGYIDNNTFNESLLVIEVMEQISQAEIYKFEGTFSQLVNYDSEWNLFKSAEQIFKKVIKSNILNNYFVISIDSYGMIFEFSVLFVDETIKLRIKLAKEESTPTDIKPDSKQMNETVEVLKLQLAEMNNEISQLKNVLNSINLSIELQNAIAEYREYDVEKDKTKKDFIKIDNINLLKIQRLFNVAKAKIMEDFFVNRKNTPDNSYFKQIGNPNVTLVFAENIKSLFYKTKSYDWTINTPGGLVLLTNNLTLTTNSIVEVKVTIDNLQFATGTDCQTYDSNLVNNFLTYGNLTMKTLDEARNRAKVTSGSNNCNNFTNMQYTTMLELNRGKYNLELSTPIPNIKFKSSEFKVMLIIHQNK